MAFRLDIGQYYDTSSPVHALDARVKLWCAFVILVGIFCISSPAQLVAGVLFVSALTLLARVPAGRILAAARPLVVLLVVLSLFNLVFVQTGEAVASLGPVVVTSGGVWASVLYSLRLVLALVMGSLILLTTPPTQLSDAFDRMLSPLGRIGVPGHEVAMVFSLMLRFVPTIADETSAIIDAQSLRGGSFDEGGPVQRVRSVIPVVVALLASCLRHADGLSRALDARCYEGGEGRTHLHESRLGTPELVASLVCAAFVVALVVLALIA